MNPHDRFYRIVEEGLCIGCGLCQSVAGKNFIRMNFTQEQSERPVVLQELSKEVVERIYQTCPGTRLEGLPKVLIDAETQMDEIWGPYQRLIRAYAADPEVRYRGSTGGVMTALGQYLLESEQVDFIVHVRASQTYPTFGERHISLDPGAVLEGAGSRYGPTAPLSDFLAILEKGQPFAFMGKPCDVSAIRNLACYDERVDTLCKFKIVMVCGGFMDAPGMRNFLKSVGTSFEEVSSFRYRGFGCPGPTRLETKEGRVVEMTYLDFWGEDASSWSLPFRCKVCPDGIGEAADIAVADTWPGGSPTEEMQKTDPGTNALIVRTALGRKLVECAAQEGSLVIEQEITPDDLSHYQPHQVDKKRAVWARYVGLRVAQQLTPQVSRLRIAELACTQSVAKNLKEARGTRQRIRLGGNREPRPIAALKQGGA